MSTGKLAIIGGGLGGLYTAYQLSRSNSDWILIEARERLGGRILSTPGPAPRHDLGPAWLWPDFQPRITTLVQTLGLKCFAQHTDGDMLLERSARQPAVRVRGLARGSPSMRIDGGVERLIEALARQLPAERILLDTRVTALRSTTIGAALQTLVPQPALAGQHFSQVISALPLRLLARDIQFEPAIDTATRQTWARTPTWMAPHAKYVALYEQAFWRDEGLCGMARSDVGPLVEIHDASHAEDHAALFGFVGVASNVRSQMDAASLLEACRRQMVRLFGSKAAVPVAHYLKDWATDELTATAADLQSSSGHGRPFGTPSPTGYWADRLLVAGSEAATEHPGYMEGALEAAEQVLNRVR